MNNRGKVFETVIEKYLKLMDVPYIRFDNYRCFKCGQVQNSKGAGWPDFFLLNPICAVEAKTGTGRLTEAQRYVGDLLVDGGVPYIELRDTLDDLIKFIEASRQ